MYFCRLDGAISLSGSCQGKKPERVWICREKIILFFLVFQISCTMWWIDVQHEVRCAVGRAAGPGDRAASSRL